MNRSEGQQDGVAIATLVLLVFAIVFGGASRLNAAPMAAVELAALPLLVIAGARFANERSLWASRRLSLVLLVALIAIPLLQMIPLPPSVWSVLPGRQDMALGLELAEAPAGWSPLSMAPDVTRAAALALLPPVAMFLGVLVASRGAIDRLIQVIVGATALSVVIGAVQLASGGERLYPYATTAAGEVTGFFANRNHLAALILVSLPFAAAIAGRAASDQGDGRLTRWAGVAYVFAAIIALGVIRSRAGVVLALPAIGAGLATAWAASGRAWPSRAIVGMAAAVVAGGTLFAGFALAPLMARFESGAGGRLDNWPTVVEAAQDFLPFGSGVGSFDAVYRSVEPLDKLAPTFFNHAHNDYIEIWLETGWVGVFFVGLFLYWWVVRTIAAWRDRRSPERHMQRAASAAVLLLLLHSTVDYPLRTLTLATLFALFAAMLERGAARRAPAQPN